MSIKVLIVDDHLVVRQALERLISNAGLQVVGHVGSGREAIEFVDSLKPEVILLDVRMPELDGLELLSRLRADRVAAKILMISSFPDSAYVARAKECFADGFITKSASCDELITAIRAVYAGDEHWTLIDALPSDRFAAINAVRAGVEEL